MTTTSGRAKPTMALPLVSFAARKSPYIASLAVLVAFFVVHAITSSGALTTFGFGSYTNAGASIALAAAGAAVVVMAGGFDLSVGAITALVNVIVATQMRDSAASIVLITVLALVVGAAAGALNGAFVTFTKLPSVIVTLATSFVWSGVALLVLASPGGSVPQSFADAITGSGLVGVPNALFVLIVAVLAWLLVSRTPLRVHLLAIGGDPAAARANGIPVGRIQIAAFALAGFVTH